MYKSFSNLVGITGISKNLFKKIKGLNAILLSQLKNGVLTKVEVISSFYALPSLLNISFSTQIKKRFWNKKRFCFQE